MDILPQIIINSLVAGSIYALIAIGFSLIYGATKFFNLAHGVMAIVGAYTVLFLTQTLGLNIFISVIGGVVLAGLLGYILDKIVYLQMRKNKASNMIMLVASLGVFTVIQAIVAMIFGSQFQTLGNSLTNTAVYPIAGGTITQIQIYIFLSLFIVGTGLILILQKTNLGKAIRAISDDEEVAKIVGINTNKVIGYVFFIGSAIAGLAGVLVGYDTGVIPTMGMFLLLKGVIAAIIGGVGSIAGAIIGAFLLGVVENFGIWTISAEWKDAIAFVLLILFLIFKPRGIMNK